MALRDLVAEYLKRRKKKEEWVGRPNRREEGEPRESYWRKSKRRKPQLRTPPTSRPKKKLRKRGWKRKYLTSAGVSPSAGG